MVLRMVLVSVVAGLGITPPAEDELTVWLRSAQTWVEARLSEWDASVGDRSALMKAELAMKAGGGVADRTVAVQDVEERDNSHEADVAIAFQESSDDTSDDARAMEAEDEAADEELAALMDEAPAAEAVVAANREVVAEAKGATVEEVVNVVVVETSEAEFDAIIEEMVAGFAIVDASASELATEAESETIGSGPELPEHVRIATDLAASLSEAEELGTLGDDFLAMEAPEDLAAAQDILSHQPALEPEPEHAPTGNQLNQAVRLTRDAAIAWFNLLQSPALMTISH